MVNYFPGTDLCGMPHINSKLTVWKRMYGSIITALANNNGVCWNNKTKMIECFNDLWDAIVKKDNNMGTMRFKAWPMFEDWKEIFGKDRATGEHAEDVMEAVNDLINEDNMAQTGIGEDFAVNFDSTYDDTEANSVCQTNKSGQETKTSGKKRKSMEPNEQLYELLGQLCQNTDEKLDNIARRIGYEYDMAEARKQLFDQLGAISGLIMDDKLDISELLANNVDRLQLFLGLPNDAKARYVTWLLEANK